MYYRDFAYLVLFLFIGFFSYGCVYDESPIQPVSDPINISLPNLVNNSDLVNHTVHVHGFAGYHVDSCTEMFCFFDMTCSENEEMVCNTCYGNAYFKDGESAVALLDQNGSEFKCNAYEVLVCNGETYYDFSDSCDLAKGKEYELVGILRYSSDSGYYLEVHEIHEYIED